jgi:hypothetical protein
MANIRDPGQGPLMSGTRDLGRLPSLGGEHTSAVGVALSLLFGQMQGGMMDAAARVTSKGQVAVPAWPPS